MDIFYITVIVILAGLFAHAHYWLARCDRLIKDLAEAVQKGARQIEFATALIRDQQAQIRTLADEVERLRNSMNIIDLPAGFRSRPRQS